MAMTATAPMTIPAIAPPERELEVWVLVLDEEEADAEGVPPSAGRTSPGLSIIV